MNSTSIIDRQFDFGDISRYRTQLMGLATLMIIACHAPASGVLMPPVFAKVLSYGNFGVDIFLFLSGLGLYYSLSKRPVENGGGYFCYCKRRLSRVFKPYIIIFLPYSFILLALGIYSISDVLLSVTAFEFWFYHRGAWFVSLIIVLYVIAPLLKAILSGKNRLLVAFCLIVLLELVIRVIHVEDASKTNILSNIIGAASRVPSFIAGMLIAPYCMEGKSKSPLWFLLLAVGSLYLSRFVFCDFWMKVPLIVYCLIILIKILSKWDWVNNALIFIGTISLESYLTNITINNLLMSLIPSRIDGLIFYGRYLEYTIVICIGLLLSYYINRQVRNVRLNNI